MPTGAWPLVAKGFVLGWSVAWPPGPINAQMLRRSLSGGFWSAVLVGAGASCGDFCWALAVILGAGAVLNAPGVRSALGMLSFVLLLVLAGVFFKSAWKSWHSRKAPLPARGGSNRSGFLLGLTLALSSPWNLAFWLAVIGRQAASFPAAGSAFTLAFAVVSGAMAWCLVFCFALRAGSRWMTPTWDAAVSALTGLLMLYFAALS